MKVSQLRARQALKRVRELEQILSRQRNAWLQEWPNGFHIATIELDPVLMATVVTARRLRHAVVMTRFTDTSVGLYACEVEK